MNCEGADFFKKILNCHFPATDGAVADDIIVATTIAFDRNVVRYSISRAANSDIQVQVVYG